MGIHFDPTINLGTIVSLVGFLGGVAVLYGRLVKLEVKVDALWDKFMARANGDRHDAQRN